ncbi:hypothetical protein BE21_54240 [Sorangium cellulosum]|uniref:Uncharacterized protein n=1 Tax=Sorangium cellulosum TaxID=56 RepID=A0A150TDQ4_SORCE|nr:hypothetical protein BE21_54240 [Sorangium cellulosum]
MWKEPDLEDLARGRSRTQAAPRLSHEIITDPEPDRAPSIPEAARGRSSSRRHPVDRRMNARGPTP